MKLSERVARAHRILALADMCVTSRDEVHMLIDDLYNEVKKQEADDE